MILETLKYKEVIIVHLHENDVIIRRLDTMCKRESQV